MAAAGDEIGPAPMVIAHDGAMADAPAMAGDPDPLHPVATTACAVTPPAAAPVSVSVTGMAADAVANIRALMTGAGDGATEIAMESRLVSGGDCAVRHDRRGGQGDGNGDDFNQSFHLEPPVW